MVNYAKAEQVLVFEKATTELAKFSDKIILQVRVESRGSTNLSN